MPSTLLGVGAASVSECELLSGLRAGDELAFRTLVKRHHQAMKRVAMTYVSSPATAEEVAQETWLAVIRGLDRFEERSSLKTWIFRILVNRAQSRGARERRTTPFSSLLGYEDADSPGAHSQVTGPRRRADSSSCRRSAFSPPRRKH
jgi:RNA polymerase sigma-70 factor (ECF subfamily)